MTKLAAITASTLAFTALACQKASPPDASKPAGETPPTETVPQKAATIAEQEVTYTGGGVTMKGFLAYDKSISGPRPGILVVHEWWGHNDYSRKRARMLAEMGYTALAVDMYGDGKSADHPDNAQKFMMEVMNNLDAGMARFQAAKALLENHETTDPTRTAAIGYCFGGGVVLHAARTGVDLDGVASFHGSLGTKTPAQKGTVKAQVLVAHGQADPMVPADAVQAFKKEMTDAGVTFRFIEYPGAQHAFTNPDADAKGKAFGLPLAYNKEADEQSWTALSEFLKQVFAA